MGSEVCSPDDAYDQRVGDGPSLVVEKRGGCFARQFGLGFGNLVANQGENLLALVHPVGKLDGDDRHAGAGCRSHLLYLRHFLKLLLQLLR